MSIDLSNKKIPKEAIQALKTIEYSYKIIKGIMYTTSNTTVCLKLAKLNLLLYTGGYYEWL